MLRKMRGKRVLEESAAVAARAPARKKHEFDDWWNSVVTSATRPKQPREERPIDNSTVKSKPHKKRGRKELAVAPINHLVLHADHTRAKPMHEVTADDILRQQAKVNDNAWDDITTTQWLELFTGWVNRSEHLDDFISDPLLRMRHLCSETCVFYNIGNLFVCYTNGNVHLCTSTACDELTHTSRGAQICRLTGLHHGIHFDTGMNQLNLANTTISQKMYGRASSSLVASADIPLPKRQAEMEYDCRHILHQLCFSAAREKTNARRIDQACQLLVKDLKSYVSECRKSNRIATMQHMMRIYAAQQAFLNQHNALSEPNKTRFESLAMLLYQISLCYWNQMKVLPLAKERKYRFAYHVMALLMFSRTGIFSETGLYILPPWPELQSLLPSVKDLGQLELKSSLYTKNRSFTRAEETFKQLLSELFVSGHLTHPVFHPGYSLLIQSSTNTK